VVFKNERTGEYVFYYVTLRATSPGVIGTIELETPVRKSAVHTLRIENPLAYALTFQTECKVPDINLPPQFTVPPNSEVGRDASIRVVFICWHSNSGFLGTLTLFRAPACSSTNL